MRPAGAQSSQQVSAVVGLDVGHVDLTSHPHEDRAVELVEVEQGVEAAVLDHNAMPRRTAEAWRRRRLLPQWAVPRRLQELDDRIGPLGLLAAQLDRRSWTDLHALGSFEVRT